MLEKFRKLIWKIIGYPQLTKEVMEAIEQSNYSAMIYPHIKDIILKIESQKDGQLLEHTFYTLQEKQCYMAGFLEACTYMDVSIYNEQENKYKNILTIMDTTKNKLN